MKRFSYAGSIESVYFGWGACAALALSVGCSSPRQFGRSALTPSAVSSGSPTPRPSARLRAIRPAPPPLPPIYPDETKAGAPWSGMQLAMRPSPQGVLVGVVSMGSPAELAGIQPGDFIFQLDGQLVSDARDILSQVERVGVGGSLRLGVHRNEGVRLFRVAPVAKPSPASAQANEPPLPSATLD